jgi:hypothetical protein
VPIFRQKRPILAYLIKIIEVFYQFFIVWDINSIFISVICQSIYKPISLPLCGTGNFLYAQTLKVSNESPPRPSVITSYRVKNQNKLSRGA